MWCAIIGMQFAAVAKEGLATSSKEVGACVPARCRVNRTVWRVENVLKVAPFRWRGFWPQCWLLEELLGRNERWRGLQCASGVSCSPPQREGEGDLFLRGEFSWREHSGLVCKCRTGWPESYRECQRCSAFKDNNEFTLAVCNEYLLSLYSRSEK